MKFGQYELLERIAIGGMAEVYKGRVVGAEGFEKLVAIKRIQPDLIADERFVTMLLTEARIHSALSHRNIVQIHDLGISEEGEYFIVLEYVEGYDLRAIMESMTADGEIIPEALSLHIAAEVAQGLHFAHELRGPDRQPLGLIHRDVSPSNVLISFAGEVKLSDFGLAKRRHDRSVVGSLKGNLIYMSPEQARQAALDRRTDVFSLGALLFELLTGKRLREITDEIKGWSEVASGVVRSARSVRPDLPASFEALLNQALAAEPGRRFPDAGTFAAAIRQLLAQMNTPVGPADLQALLSLVRPPKRPRGELDRSKVIRLGPDANQSRTAPGIPAQPVPAQAEDTPPPAAAASAPSAPSPSPPPPTGVGSSPLERLRAQQGSATTTTSPAWRVMPPTPSPGAKPSDDMDAFPPTPPPASATLSGTGPAARAPALAAPTIARSSGRLAPPSAPLQAHAGAGNGPVNSSAALGAHALGAETPPAAPSVARTVAPDTTNNSHGSPPSSPHHTWAGGFALAPGAAPASAAGPRPAPKTMRGPLPTPPLPPGVAKKPAPPPAVPLEASQVPTPPAGTSGAPSGARARGANHTAPPPRSLSPGPDIATVETPPPTPGPTPLPPGQPSVDWSLRPTPPPVVAHPAPPPGAWAPVGAAIGTSPSTALGADKATPAPAVPSPREAAPSAPSWQPMQTSRSLQPVEDLPPPLQEPRSLPLVLPIGLWRWVAVGAAGLLVLIAFIVHVGVVPLEVLVSWKKPAQLYIASEPEGGVATLDGVRLIDPTPSKVPVTRDRQEHVLEVEYPGYKAARETVRFDRSVALSFVLTLEKEGDDPIQPVSGPPSANSP